MQSTAATEEIMDNLSEIESRAACAKCGRLMRSFWLLLSMHIYEPTCTVNRLGLLRVADKHEHELESSLQRLQCILMGADQACPQTTYDKDQLRGEAALAVPERLAQVCYELTEL